MGAVFPLVGRRKANLASFEWECLSPSRLRYCRLHLWPLQKTRMCRGDQNEGLSRSAAVSSLAGVGCHPFVLTRCCISCKRREATSRFLCSGCICKRRATTDHKPLKPCAKARFLQKRKSNSLLKKKLAAVRVLSVGRGVIT